MALAPWLSAAVTNGSFNGASNPEPRSYVAGVHAPSGWVGAQGSMYGGLDQWDTSNPPAIGPSPGYNSFDAWAPMGSSSDGGHYMVFRSMDLEPATLSQGISGLLPNTTYAVQFEMANMTVGDLGVNNALLAIGRSGYFNVSLSGTLEGVQSTLLLPNPEQTDINLSVMGSWVPVTLTFTTSSSVTPEDILNLQFAHMYDRVYDPDIDQPNLFYGQLALDGVSITQVPEPTSMVLVTIAMGVAVLPHRRRPRPH